MSGCAGRPGHGSLVWFALLAALGFPASKLTVSRRSRYMSVHAPSIVVAARAAIVMPRNLIRRMVLSLADVEDVADRCRTAIDASLEAVFHPPGCLPPPPPQRNPPPFPHRRITPPPAGPLRPR